METRVEEDKDERRQTGAREDSGEVVDDAEVESDTVEEGSEGGSEETETSDDVLV